MKRKLILLALYSCSIACCIAIVLWGRSRMLSTRWNSEQSYTALRDIVDTKLAPFGAGRGLGSREKFLSVLGRENSYTDYPGVEGNLLVYRGATKACDWIDMLATFAADDSLLSVRWIDPSRFPWGDVDLPEALYAPSLIEGSPLTCEIAIDEFNRILVGYSVMSPEELDAYLRQRYKRYGELPVLIGADQSLTFGDVWRVAVLCRSMGLWRMNFQVVRDRETGMLSCLDVAAPVEENDEHRRGPVIMKGTRDSDEILKILVGKDGFGLMAGGKSSLIDKTEMDRQLTRLSKMADNVSVLCLPSDEAAFGDFIAVLDILSKAGLKNVCVMERYE